jgi:outer membrane biosynthesis protein TonB
MIGTRLCLAAAALAALPLMAAGCGIGKAQTHLRTAVDSRKPTLDSCYGAALERDDGAAGEMALSIHVSEKSGAVDRVEVVRSALGDPDLERCVESALVGTRIDPKPKANLQVEYTLRFVPTT